MTENERRRMPSDTPEWAGDAPPESWPARPEAAGRRTVPDALRDDSTEDPLVVSELEERPEEESAELPLVIDDEPENEAELEERAHAEHAAGEISVPDGYTMIEGYPSGHRRTVAIVVSRFNGEITNRMLASALAELDAAGVAREAVTVMPVPGAFELPLGAMALAKTRRYSCVVTLGCVIRGDTAHFDYVAGEAASGLQLAALETGVPVAFGVLTTETVEQARERIDKGADAVRTALEMADVFAQVRAQARA
jgi:6,7-dimethyl-8-ribityllumazine synthase